jgi:hypothetical protein
MTDGPVFVRVPGGARVLPPDRNSERETWTWLPAYDSWAYDAPADPWRNPEDPHARRGRGR